MIESLSIRRAGTALCFLTTLAAASWASPPITQCWTGFYDGGLQGSNIPDQIVIDPDTGDCYVVSEDITQSAWALNLRKSNIFGLQNFSVHVTVPQFSEPEGIAFDSHGNVYVGDLEPTSQSQSIINIYKFTSKGSLAGAHKFSSSFKPGPNLLGLATDSSDNILIGLNVPTVDYHGELELIQMSPSFSVLRTFTDNSIQPTRGFFGPAGDFFASGSQALSSQTSGGRIARYPFGFERAWFDNFDTVNTQTGGEKEFFPSLFPGVNPGECLLGLQIDDIESGGTVNTFQVSSIDPTGKTLWTSPIKNGNFGSAAVGSPSDFYFSYYVQPMPTQIDNHFMRLGKNGVQGFDMVFPQFIFAADGTSGAFLSFIDPSVNQVAIKRLNPGGTVLSSIIPTILNNGKPQSVANMMELHKVGPGLLALGQVQSGPTSDDVFLGRFVDTVTLQRVSLPAVQSGKTGTGVIYLDGPAPAGGIPVTVVGQGPFVYNGVVNVAAGATSGTFDFNAPSVDKNTKGSFLAHTSDGTLRNASTVIAGAKLISVQADNATIKGGNVWGATLYFSLPTGPDGMKVTMTSDNPAIIPNATFDIDAGQVTAKVGDLSHKPNVDTNVTLTFTDPDHGSVKVTIKVTAK